jgi:uncharacterized protein (TIGR03083 family)
LAPDIWNLIHAERRALADDLSGLVDEHWSVRSLCSEWNVLQVLGHLTSESKMTTRKFLVRIVGSGFRFNTLFNNGIAEEIAGGHRGTLAEFRAHITDTTSPPGPKDTWLGEVVLHAEDIRRPLGIPHSYDAEALRRIAEFIKTQTRSQAPRGGLKDCAYVRQMLTGQAATDPKSRVRSCHSPWQ